MPKFSSREEYELWKTQTMEHLGVKPTEPDPVERQEQYEQQSAPPVMGYASEGGGDAGGGTGRWVFVFVIAAVVGIGSLFLFGGKSKPPETAPAATTESAPGAVPEAAPEGADEAGAESSAKPFNKKGTRSVADMSPLTAPPPPISMGEFMRNVEDARAAHADQVARAREAMEDINSYRPPHESSELTLDNQTDMDVLVKVVGDANYTRTANVRAHASSTITCRTGSFYLKMRYREKNGNLIYQKGDNFSLDSFSKTTITLHKVVGGNYGSSSMRASDF